MHGKYNSNGPTRRSTTYDKVEIPDDGDSMFAKVMKKASNMRLSNMASTAVGAGKFASDDIVRSCMARPSHICTNESSTEKLVKSPIAGQIASSKHHSKKRKSAAGLSPVTSANRRSKDFADDDRIVAQAKAAKVAKMKEDNDKLLRAYERGMINAKSPGIGGTAKHHRRQASSHKRNAGLSPSEAHDGTQSKLQDQYYSTKKEWTKASPYH